MPMFWVEIVDDETDDGDYFGPFHTHEAAGAWCVEKGIAPTIYVMDPENDPPPLH
jgi:hypothetical protein